MATAVSTTELSITFNPVQLKDVRFPNTLFSHERVDVEVNGVMHRDVTFPLSITNLEPFVAYDVTAYALYRAGAQRIATTVGRPLQVLERLSATSSNPPPHRQRRV